MGMDDAEAAAIAQEVADLQRLVRHDDDVVVEPRAIDRAEARVDRLERRLGNGPLDVDQSTFRSVRNRRNNYMLDRQVQKTESFTGIEGINTQDRAIQESMGRIVDRSREHLGPADKAVIQARRLLLQAVKTVGEGGTPRGVAATSYGLRAVDAVLPRDADWRSALTPETMAARIEQTV
jgi:hypothetical protein